MYWKGLKGFPRSNISDLFSCCCHLYPIKFRFGNGIMTSFNVTIGVVKEKDDYEQILNTPNKGD